MADVVKPERPIFCGNFEYDIEEHEIQQLFDKFGPVIKVDMKQGFAFVYMQDKRDGDDAIEKLDGTEFGTKQRKLKVQWAKMTEADRKRDGLKPTQTLFVVNFDHTRVTSQDLEDYFSYYGALSRVQIKKNFAFVEFLQLEDSIKAFDACNGKVFKGRTITIEYTQNSGAAAAPRAPPPERRNDDRRYERERSPPPRKRSRSPVYDRDRDYDRRPVPSYSSRDPPPRAEYRSSRYEERDRYDDRNRSPPRRSSHYSPPRRYSPPRNTRRY